MDAKHTPGPWIFDLVGSTYPANKPQTGQTYRISTPGEATFSGKSIARIEAVQSEEDHSDFILNKCRYSNEECLANAQLMSASPELADVVKELRWLLGAGETDTERARIAFIRAGEVLTKAGKEAYNG